MEEGGVMLLQSLRSNLTSSSTDVFGFRKTIVSNVRVGGDAESMVLRS